MASFAMSFAMANLGWKFYIINACIDIIFLAVVYFLFIETAGLTLEEITHRFEGTKMILHGAEESPAVDDKLGVVVKASSSDVEK